MAKLKKPVGFFDEHESDDGLEKELTNQLTNQLTDELTNEIIDDRESFLTGLKRLDSDKKMVGFHLPGDVRRALKKLKADEYEMSEVVAQLLRKHLPKKYFE